MIVGVALLRGPISTFRSSPVCRTRRTSASSSQAAVDRFLLARGVQRAFERTFAALTRRSRQRATNEPSGGG
jgi:hypothetical protein